MGLEASLEFALRHYLKQSTQLHTPGRLLQFYMFTRLDILLSNERITKALSRLRECAGWSAPLLFACNKIGVLLTRPNYAISNKSIAVDECSYETLASHPH